MLALAALAALAVMASTTLALHLAFPTAPDDSEFLKFEGFVELPRSGLLSALDYVAAEGGHVFVASISSGDLLDVSLGEGGAALGAGVRRSWGGGIAHGIAVVASEQVGFITRAGLNVVDVFDLQTLRVVQRISVPDDPDAIIFDAASNLIYVASGDARMASLIDAKTREIVGTIPLPGKPEFAVVDSRTGLLYQALTDTNTIATIDLRKRAVVDTWRIATCDGPSGLAIGTPARRLFVVCSGSNTLSVLNIDTAQIVASMPIGKLSDSVVFDDALRRVYVAGGAGQLTLIQDEESDRYRVLGNVGTQPGAHTLALDQHSHRVYLAYSGILGMPRLAVFAAGH